MQAYFEPEQAFSIIMPQPVFEIAIAYKKKHVLYYLGSIPPEENLTECELMLPLV